MNTLTKQPVESLNWPMIVVLTLSFWLSASLVIDLVVIPGLFASGMMQEAGFLVAGYFIFGVFNHLELLCAALILSGFLFFYRSHHFSATKEGWAIFLAVLLLAIALTDTYGLTPALSSFGFEMNLFNGNPTMPSGMMTMHGFYWSLELLKLLLGATLLRWCYHDVLLGENGIE